MKLLMTPVLDEEKPASSVFWDNSRYLGLESRISAMEIDSEDGTFY